MKRLRGTDHKGPETWGSRFQARRDNIGLSQIDISKITGLTQQCVSRFENDRVDPRFSTLEKLARSVGMEVNQLFPPEMRASGVETDAAKAAKAHKRALRERQRGAA